jgi:hypothetical protein
MTCGDELKKPFVCTAPASVMRNLEIVRFNAQRSLATQREFDGRIDVREKENRSATNPDSQDE